ncbi:uncharacterized protein LOC135144374 [Zophobas morio]|uniref:uncharacterized protein LOC135144374 n=1 Tax=Zophobas morio TaxID=2755281 RepID=UPI0030829303
MTESEDSSARCLSIIEDLSKDSMRLKNISKTYLKKLSNSSSPEENIKLLHNELKSSIDSTSQAFIEILECFGSLLSEKEKKVEIFERNSMNLINNIKARQIYLKEVPLSKYLTSREDLGHAQPATKEVRVENLSNLDFSPIDIKVLNNINLENFDKTPTNKRLIVANTRKTHVPLDSLNFREERKDDNKEDATINKCQSRSKTGDTKKGEADRDDNEIGSSARAPSVTPSPSLGSIDIPPPDLEAISSFTLERLSIASAPSEGEPPDDDAFGELPAPELDFEDLVALTESLNYPHAIFNGPEPDLNDLPRPETDDD